MKNGRRWIIIGLVVIVVLAFMTTYTVKFTEKAIVTTFGAASATPVEKPGLKFTVPYIQSVTKYDTRVRYLESKPETHQTKDSRQLVVTSYVTWRVSDPNVFYQKFSAKGDKASNHYKGAEQLLGDAMRGAMGEISQFTFTELLTTTGNTKLEECEKQMLARLVAAMSDVHGIEPVGVGIVGIEFPENMTSEVFQRMQQERATLANQATSEGKAIAETIRQNATNAATKIMAFANARANQIRSQGDIEQKEYLLELSKEPDLAIFLKNLELMRSAFATNKATLVIPAGPMGGWSGMELFNPGAGAALNSGWMPEWNFSQKKLEMPAAPGVREAPGGATPPAKSEKNVRQDEASGDDALAGSEGER